MFHNTSNNVQFIKSNTLSDIYRRLQNFEHMLVAKNEKSIMSFLHFWGCKYIYIYIYIYIYQNSIKIKN